MNDFIYHYGEIISAVIGCILIVLVSLRLFGVWPFDRESDSLEEEGQSEGPSIGDLRIVRKSTRWPDMEWKEPEETFILEVFVVIPTGGSKLYTGWSALRTFRTLEEAQVEKMTSNSVTTVEVVE